MRRYRRLQHQLFRWLALTIGVTVLVVALVFRLTQPAEPWLRRLDQASSFVAARFAERWDDPIARDALASELAETFGATLWMLDRDGQPLGVAGPADCQGLQKTLALPGARGRVRVCLQGQRRFSVLAGLAVLGAACLVLWTAAALVARRMTRPLTLLIGATREIGSGNLSARVRLGRHQGGELGLLAESVNDMAQRIERQLRDQRELLAAVSHEVRSPLSRLRICAELLRGDGPKESILDAVEREILELDNLVGQLLASSRLDFETLTKRRVVAAELLAEVLVRRQLSAELVEDQSGGASVNIDPTLIARALDNLLDNAVRHGRGPTRCVLRIALAAQVPAKNAQALEPTTGAGESRPTGSALVFEVHDQGPGFEPQSLPRVFEAFYRAGAAAHSEPGSLGLGLALVRRIARAHGGQAWAANLPAGGACVAFSVSL
jgi:two-component system, OmpR family, sensor kinase